MIVFRAIQTGGIIRYFLHDEVEDRYYVISHFNDDFTFYTDELINGSFNILYNNELYKKIVNYISANTKIKIEIINEIADLPDTILIFNSYIMINKRLGKISKLCL